ncbi:MAG: hypothetical protein BWY57_00759 [Betaproteobacteria bacterium ADurb.Bin341]|nr:MAG: hypothetical protein BWY57_00759 [Betaproteobacteria bacterium ADurb.Bin341]
MLEHAGNKGDAGAGEQSSRKKGVLWVRVWDNVDLIRPNSCRPHLRLGRFGPENAAKAVAFGLSKGDMGRLKFAPHGEFSVSTEGRILVVRTTGPWNKELIQLYSQKVTENVEALVGAPWGMLGVISEEGLHTPDSFSATVATVRRHRTQGRTASAVVLQNVSAPETVRKIFTKLYTEADEPFAFFDDEALARSWLAERLREAGVDCKGAH